jgi:hypothetical protein
LQLILKKHCTNLKILAMKKQNFDFVAIELTPLTVSEIVGIDGGLAFESSPAYQSVEATGAFSSHCYGPQWESIEYPEALCAGLTSSIISPVFLR